MGRLDETQETPANNQGFVQRATRFTFDAPAAFYLDGRRVGGRCLNLSESGVLATFDQALDIWTTGELVINLEERMFTLHVRVARLEGLQAGLAFRAQTETERESIRLLMDLAAPAAEAQPSEGNGGPGQV